jgi:cystathionine beta-synthase
VGYTSGAAMQAVKQYESNGMFTKDSNVVVILPDHGSRYMSKIYNDEWMESQGFFDAVQEVNPKKIEYIK